MWICLVSATTLRTLQAGVRINKVSLFFLNYSYKNKKTCIYSKCSPAQNSSVKLEVMFSRVYRWHSWGKEVLLICPKWPRYVRGWTRIWIHILSQRWFNVYHIWIHFCTLGATRLRRWYVLCRICVPFCDLIKLCTAAATSGKGLLG